MCVYSHKRQMHFQQLSCIRNNFGDQPARPAPTSAPPRNPGFGQARLRLRRATRARVGASRDRHGAPRQSRGCAPLRAGRPRSQGTAALSGDARAPTAALPGNGCAPRGRLRSGNGCAAFSGDGCAPRERLRSRGRLRRSQGTAAAFSGNGCAPRDGCGVLRERLRSQGTAALPGNGCAPRGRLRSQGTAAFSGGGCSSRQVDKDCVFEPAGPAGANLTSRGTHRTGTIEPPIAGRSMCPARGEPQDQGHFTLRSKDRYR